MMEWSQNGRTLRLTVSAGSVRARMPGGWRLEDVHPSVLAVAGWLLLSQVLPEECPDYREILALPHRKPGSVDLLSFSGGADSLAALLLSDALPVYLARSYDCYPWHGSTARLGSTVAVERLVAEVGAVVVESDFEKLGLMVGLRHGFRDGYGYGALIALLADHYDAGVLSFGGILDTIWMGTGDLSAAGSRYVDIANAPGGVWARHRALFAVAGLAMSLPVGGCSETITVKLAPQGVSCPKVADDGTPCGACFKCFRKEQLLGRRAEAARVRTHLTHRPLKMATTVIHGCHMVGAFPPELEEFRDVETSWTERHYDRSLDVLCPPPQAATARARLAARGVQPMTDDDVRVMQGFLQ